jgi:hypothetical protein
MMRRITFEGVVFDSKFEPVITNDLLDQFECEKKTKLPGDYRQFLIQVNGGVPTPCGIRRFSDHSPALGLDYDPEFHDNLYPKNKKLSKEIVNFFKNAYVPRRVQSLNPFDCKLGEGGVPLTNWEGWRFPDYPDSRSLIMIGSVEDDSDNDLYISTCKDYFGYVYLGHYNDYDVGLNPFSKEDDPFPCILSLDELERDCVGKSFTDFLHHLFSGDLMLADGYMPSKEVLKIGDYVTYLKLYGPDSLLTEDDVREYETYFKLHGPDS